MPGCPKGSSAFFMPIFWSIPAIKYLLLHLFVNKLVYLDINLKEQAKNIYKHYSLSLSRAVNMFLAQSVFNKEMVDHMAY